MSGLVTGLQNRAQRFESASDLENNHRLDHLADDFLCLCPIAPF